MEFNFDRKTLENDFARTNQEEQYKSLSQKLSAVLAAKRTETITKLIAEEDNEVKEEIQSELDNQLAEAAFKLNNELRLEGIMLEGIKLLSSDQNTFEQCFMQDASLDQHAKAFVQNELSQLVDNVSKLRNEHAHIKAMSLEKFEELWNLLFEEGKSQGTLKQLLEFKRQINKNRESS